MSYGHALLNFSGHGDVGRKSVLGNTIEAFDRYSCNAVTIPINILKLFRCISYQKYNSAVQIHPQAKEPSKPPFQSHLSARKPLRRRHLLTNTITMKSDHR